MLLGKTGLLPLEFYIKVKMMGFWVSLISGERDKISFKMYLVSLTLYNDGFLKFEWLKFIESIIHECGLSFVFENQLGYDKKWLKNFFMTKIKLALSWL